MTPEQFEAELKLEQAREREHQRYPRQVLIALAEFSAAVAVVFSLKDSPNADVELARNVTGFSLVFDAIIRSALPRISYMPGSGIIHWFKSLGRR